MTVCVDTAVATLVEETDSVLGNDDTVLSCFVVPDCSRWPDACSRCLFASGSGYMATFFKSPAEIPTVLGAGATFPIVVFFLFLGTNVDPVDPALLAMLAAATRVRADPPVDVEGRRSEDDESRAVFPPLAPSAPPGRMRPRTSRSAAAALLGVGVAFGAVVEELKGVLGRLMLLLEERETGRRNDRRERDCVSVEDVSSIDD